jgi:preprotein translocase SecE subunit
MAMSVAENPVTEQTARNPQHQFAIASGIGAIVLLAVLGLIFAALPFYWGRAWENVFSQNKDLLENHYLSDALLILLELVLIGFIGYGIYQVLQQQKQPGVRAGIFVGAVYCLAALWICFWIGRRLQGNNFGQDNPAVGWAAVGAIFAAFIAAAGYVYAAVPGFFAAMEAFEEQGWFHGTPYKPNQGVRVRRGTIVGILAVGVAGIFTMVQHRIFGYERPDPDSPGSLLANDWIWGVPFNVPEQELHAMYKVHLVMPLVLGLGLLWVAYRVVNIPVFADFLIATEAEMNKVSWTTRKRLVQDTIVVLTTVFLFTMFLFVVDIVWIKVLSAPYIQVLLFDPKAKEKEQQETAKW